MTETLAQFLSVKDAFCQTSDGEFKAKSEPRTNTGQSQSHHHQRTRSQRAYDFRRATESMLFNSTSLLSPNISFEEGTPIAVSSHLHWCRFSLNNSAIIIIAVPFTAALSFTSTYSSGVICDQPYLLTQSKRTSSPNLFQGLPQTSNCNKNYTVSSNPDNQKSTKNRSY